MTQAGVPGRFFSQSCKAGFLAYQPSGGGRRLIMDNPYVGPLPFTELQSKYFCGREEEARELASLVIAHRAVLLYSQSGVGKTSLINAALVPKFKAQGHEVIRSVRVGVKLPADVDLSRVNNVFCRNAMLSSTEKKVRWQDLLDVDFVQFLKTHSADGLRVLVFDQFEELFSTYRERNSDRQVFLDKLCEVLESDSRIRVLISMREEQIANLDPYCEYFPEKLRIRRRL